MESEVFTISTPNFEGPLSLLLDLVQRRKVFISDIALADVADEFVKTIEQQDRSMAEDARFISVASTLLLIKSKSLLPHFVLTPEEESSAEELKERLLAFEALRLQTESFEEVYGKNILSLRKASKDERIFFVPDETASLQKLRERLGVLISNLPAREMPERVSIKQTVRLEDVILNMTNRIKRHLAGSFKDFARLGEAPKRDVVVYFIALLELVRQGFVEAHQEEPGGDIQLKHQEVTVPNYS